MKKTTTPKGLSADQAAAELGVSVRTIRKLLATGELRSVKIGRLRRIPASEIDRLLTGGTST